MTGPLWHFPELLAASGGVADGSASAVHGISIDTRTLQPGDLFVALRDARDGHEFVPAAFKAGAAAALVSPAYRRQGDDGALIRVDDPLRGLERIAIAARARLASNAQVVAVTGSAGKTGTKEMLHACLSMFGATHAPDKSFNNHWGVPLTLARMPAETEFAVIEIGVNHAGEITPLTGFARPHVAVITNVLPVHIGNFPDGEPGIAAAKAEILLGLEPDGTAVLPRDNPHYPFLEGRARARGARIVSFGTETAATVSARTIEPGDNGTTIAVVAPSGHARLQLGAPGRHLAANAIAVAAVLEVLGLPLGTGLSPLASVRAPQGRGARTVLELAAGRVLLIDESYNANPASMRAALAAMASVPRDEFPRRIAVLGDMLELGDGSAGYHLGLKDAIDAAGVDLVFASGPMMLGLYETLRPDIRGGWAPAAADIAEKVLSELRQGDVAMVKGSLGSRMAPVVEAIRKAGRPVLN